MSFVATEADRMGAAQAVVDEVVSGGLSLMIRVCKRAHRKLSIATGYVHVHITSRVASFPNSCICQDFRSSEVWENFCSSGLHVD